MTTGALPPGFDPGQIEAVTLEFTGTVVPEPSALLLFATGVIVVWRGRALIRAKS